MTGEPPPPPLRWLFGDADQRRIARRYWLRDPVVGAAEARAPLCHAGDADRHVLLFRRRDHLSHPPPLSGKRGARPQGVGGAAPAGGRRPIGRRGDGPAVAQRRAHDARIFGDRPPVGRRPHRGVRHRASPRGPGPRQTDPGGAGPSRQLGNRPGDGHRLRPLRVGDLRAAAEPLRAPHRQPGTGPLRRPLCRRGPPQRAGGGAGAALPPRAVHRLCRRVHPWPRAGARVRPAAADRRQHRLRGPARRA